MIVLGPIWEPQLGLAVLCLCLVHKEDGWAGSAAHELHRPFSLLCGCGAQQNALLELQLAKRPVRDL